MATQRIIYFTAGITATAGELADIAALNAAAEAPYEVIVANGAANAKYGETNRLIPTDYVAGTIPTIYNAVPTIDPDNLPVSGLKDTQAIVTDGEVLDEEGGGTITVAVADGVATYTYTPGA